MRADWPFTLAEDGVTKINKLPAPQWDGMQSEWQDSLLRSQVDSGPAKQRRRFTGVSQYLTCYWVFNTPELEIFEDWFFEDLGIGANDFNWINPFNNVACVARFRKPYIKTPFSTPGLRYRLKEGGQPNEYEPYLYALWKIAADIEILP